MGTLFFPIKETLCFKGVLNKALLKIKKTKETIWRVAQHDTYFFPSNNYNGAFNTDHLSQILKRSLLSFSNPSRHPFLLLLFRGVI